MGIPRRCAQEGEQRQSARSYYLNVDLNVSLDSRSSLFSPRIIIFSSYKLVNSMSITCNFREDKRERKIEEDERKKQGARFRYLDC